MLGRDDIVHQQQEAMNYLAHVFLARQSDDAMVGAVLGDFAKANIDGIYAPAVELEIRLHRSIDIYTDSHATVRDAVQLFAQPRRRFAGIVLDVFYDHLLARRWATYSAMPLREFIDAFYQALATHDGTLPERLRDIAPYMIEQDWLGKYHDFAGVEWAVNRMSQRLSRSGDLLRAGLEDVREHYDAIAAGFDSFFPQLIAFSLVRRGELALASR